MISFENTQIAFSSKSNAELNRAYWLFKLVGSPALVKIGKSLTNFAMALHIPIKPFIKATIFKQFCGGETIDECSATIENLGKFNIGTILDYSVEGKEDEKDFDVTTQEIINTILKAKNSKYIPFSVFKVTGICRFSLLEKVNAKKTLNENETAEFERAKKRIEKICAHGFEHGIPVLIDAEESWIQDAIDSIVEEMMQKFNKEKAIVYNTLQMYRHDRLAFLKQSYEKAVAGNYFLGVKIVRGAYMEKERARAAEKGYPSPIQPDKASCDRDYDAALKFCVEHYERIALCAGTHNEKSSALLAELLLQKNMDKKHPHFYFAQLLGMSDHISFNLSNAGYNVAKYVPYGPVKEVLPYLIRRAEENTSVAGQTGRELSLIIKERKRRKADV
ncbi:MAG: proline dehydrogenase family protein [Bacteroidia bacterium]